MFSNVKKNDVSYIVVNFIPIPRFIPIPFRHSVPRFIPIPFRVLSPFRSAFPFRVLSPLRSAFLFRSAIPSFRFRVLSQPVLNEKALHAKLLKEFRAEKVPGHIIYEETPQFNQLDINGINLMIRVYGIVISSRCLSF